MGFHSFQSPKETILIFVNDTTTKDSHKVSSNMTLSFNRNIEGARWCSG